MPKRSNEEKIEHYNNKIRKLQAIEHRKRRRRIVYSSSSSSEGDSDIEQNADQGPANEPARAGEDLQPADALTGDTSNGLPVDKTSSDQTENNQESATVPDLDPEILSALGEVVEDTPKFGEKIHDSLAKIWQPILRKGLNKDTKEKVLKQYLVPENCTLLQAPKLNPEISAAVSDPTRSKDKRVEAVQQQLGLGITALNRGIALLLDSDKDRVQAIKHLSDSCRILCDLHFGETEARKKFITPGLDKAFLNVINEVDRDEMLFGNKLSEKIKASKIIEKQGLQIKKPAPTPKPQSSASTSTSSSSRSRSQGNWSAPPRYSSNKGMYKQRPSWPKYNSTWDTQIVLNHISNWYPNIDLSLQNLTKKLTVLLAICTAHRVQTFSLIKVNNIMTSPSGIKILIPDIIKTSKPGQEQPVLNLPFFRENPKICPAVTLNDYLSVTSNLRPDGVDNLLITFKKPHKKASTQSISRWIKQTMAESGIDTNVFSAHSTRHASTSAAAAAGVSVDTIRKAAGWSGTSQTFARFYHRPISDDVTFARAVCLSNTVD